ncbi:MAG: hypothetical protein H0T51_13650 [Pirellulales bacterium]|nr:hypothetical protein [Pirellulales bacterium]
MANATIYLNAPTDWNVPQSIDDDVEVGWDATLSANADISVYSVTVFRNAVFNVNANVDVTRCCGMGSSQGLRVYEPSTLRLNSGRITSQIALIDRASLIQAGGSYAFGKLDLKGVGLLYGADDQITESVAFTDGSRLTLDKDLIGLQRVAFWTNSTIELQGHLASSEILAIGGATEIDRGVGGAFHAKDFYLGAREFVYEGPDLVTGIAYIDSKSTFVVNQPLSLSGAHVGTGWQLAVRDGSKLIANAALDLSRNLTVLHPGSSATINGALKSGSVSVSQKAQIDTYGPVDTFELEAYDAVLNTHGVVSTRSIKVDSGGIYTANAPVDANHIWVRRNSTLVTNADVDVVHSLEVGDANFRNDASQMIVKQGLTTASGVTLNYRGWDTNFYVNYDAKLRLQFDDVQSPGGIDWAFRWQGQHVEELKYMLGTKILAEGAPRPVEVIYDPIRFGYYTYIGYLTVPEPHAQHAIWLAVIIALAKARSIGPMFAKVDGI